MDGRVKKLLKSKTRWIPSGKKDARGESCFVNYTIKNKNKNKEKVTKLKRPYKYSLFEAIFECYSINEREEFKIWDNIRNILGGKTVLSEWERHESRTYEDIKNLINKLNL